MHLIYESRLKVLPDRGHSTTEPDVLIACGLGCLIQCPADAVYEEEFGPAVHPDGCSRVVGEHENGRVVRRTVAPPSLPCVVDPRPSNRSEDVAAEKPRADAREAPLHEVVVDASRPPVLARDLTKGPSIKDPFMKRDAAGAQRVFEVLARPRAISVKRDGEAVDSQPRH